MSDTIVEMNFEELEALVKRSVWSVSKHWDDDYEQEAWLAVMSAVPRWNPEEGPFPAFCARRTQGAIIDFIRRRDGRVNRHGRRRIMVPLDFDVAADDIEISAVEQRDEVARVMRRLSPKEQRVFRLTAAGMQQNEIAEALHVSPTRIGQIMTDARKWLGPRR